MASTRIETIGNVKLWHVIVIVVGLILLFALGGEDLADALLRMG